MILNINTSEARKFQAKLETMGRSALPVAVRSALNSVAFNVKKDTMPTKAEHTFEKREPNFFKANSRVDMAKGFDIKGMRSTVGFIEGGLKGGSNYAVADLEEQEHGGVIEKKSFIPMVGARSGKNNKRLVRPNARLSAINKLADIKNAKGKNEKERFTKSGIYAGKGGNVLVKGILYKINSVKRLKNGNTVFNKTALYSYKKGRTVTIQRTDFMREASLQSRTKLDDFFIKEAARQILKLR